MLADAIFNADPQWMDLFLIIAIVVFVIAAIVSRPSIPQILVCLGLAVLSFALLFTT